MSAPNQFVGERVGKNRIELVALLGEGSYGCVYRGVLHEGGIQKECAVKCMDRSNLDAHHLMCQRREINLHQRVSEGRGVVSLYDTFIEGDYQFIVMELCRDGDLWEGIANGKYAEQDGLIRDVFSQVLESVEYCHSKHVFHRDIKPENILLSDGKVLLADFGLASGSPVSNEMRCGSPWYMSPECWGGVFDSDRPYATAPNDVWCLGILLINLACGRHAPWKQATRRDLFFRDFLKQPRMLRLLLPLSSQVHDLLARVFATNPAARISIPDFQIAIKNIKCFAIPLAKRKEFQEYQRAAWSGAICPSPSRPLSIDTLRIVPVTSSSASSSSCSSFSDEEGIDITDAAKDFFTPFVLQSSDSFIRNITIVDTSPHACRVTRPEATPSRPPPSQPLVLSSSSTSSTDSEGPITPEMSATIVDIEVPDIDQDVAEALYQPDGAKPAADKVLVVASPIQNILRAIRAL